jgi:biotin carboxylase
MKLAKKVLMVYTRGGAPIEYAVPHIAARAELHVLALQPLPSVGQESWRSQCTSIIDGRDTDLTRAAVTERVVSEASRIVADGIITLSEFSVESVAQAAEILRVPGAGPNAIRARDKRLMRETWEKAKVPSPRFRPVGSEAELREAFRELTAPVLLKAAWGTGSVGQVLIEHERDIPRAWASTSVTVAEAHKSGFMRLQQPGAVNDFLVEEVIPGSTRTWWPEDSGYGDYVSVEGIVADGVCYSLCITSRIPTIPPFTELSNLAPCVLTEDRQRRIEAVARAAVDALELENCGTHTELKLKDNGEVAVLETAARFGGVMVLPEIEHVYGFDALGALVDILTGGKPSLPPRMFTDAQARGAAGSLSLIATDAHGHPWQQRLVWDSTLVEWDRLLSEGSTIQAAPGLCIADGTLMPEYDPAAGARGYGGIFFLRCADAPTLVRDCHSVLNGLEDALSQGWARKSQG